MLTHIVEMRRHGVGAAPKVQVVRKPECLVFEVFSDAEFVERVAVE